MSKIRCGCTKCEFNNNRECQADDVEIKASERIGVMALPVVPLGENKIFSNY